MTDVISPTSVTVPVDGDRQFTARVSGSANAAVTWTVNDVAGGHSTIGTLDGSGTFSSLSQYGATLKVVGANESAL